MERNLLKTMTREKAVMLGRRLSDLILQGVEERSPFASDWKQNRNDYNDVPIPFASAYLQGYTDLPAPCASPRANALSDYVLGAVLSQDPIVTTGIYASAEEARAVEKASSFFFEISGLHEVLKQGHASAWCTNHQILCSTWNNDKQKFDYLHIQPECFVVAGCGFQTIDDSPLVGHSFVMRRMEIMATKGYVLPDSYIPGVSIWQNDSDARQATSRPPTNGDEPCELWQVTVKVDLDGLKEGEPYDGKNEKSYIAVVDAQAKEVLSLEENPEEMSMYTVFGYLPAPEAGFWTQTSLGKRMQGPHRAYNYITNLILSGSVMMAHPPVIMRGSMGSDENQNITPGFAMQGADATTIAGQFNPSLLDVMLVRIERDADSVSRIASAGIAKPTGGRKTATEIEQIAMGQDSSVTGYVATYSIGLARLAEYQARILRKKFDSWFGTYYQFFEDTPALSAEAFDRCSLWDVPGKNPSTNSAIQRRNLEGFAQTVVNLAQVDPNLIANVNTTELMRLIAFNADIQNVERVLNEQTQNPNAAQDQGLAPDDGGPGNGIMEGILAGLQGGMPGQGEQPESAL